MESGISSDGKVPYISRLLRTMLEWNAEFSSCQSRRRRRSRSISCVEQVEARCLLTAGALDTSFSDDGILVDQFQDGAFGGGQKILTQSDNSFYVIGDGTILRYLANGQLDPSFSYDGMAGFAVGFERVPATITDGAIQADGKLMLLGQTYLGPAGYYAPTSKEVVLRRFNIDGTIDTSFGTDGTVKPALTTAVSVAVRSDGKILVTGTVGSGVTAEGAIARLEANGAIDSTFDGDGVRASLPNSLGSIVIQADDRMLVQGSVKLYRFAADGSFDNTFDTDGELVSPTTLFALQSDGRIVALGSTTVGGQPEFAIYRYNSDGSADTSFDTDGVLNTTFGHAETPTAVSLLPNGNIFISGKNTTGTLGVFAMYSTTGTLDTTFTGSGKLYWNLNWHTSVVRSNGTLLLMRHYSTNYPQSLYVRPAAFWNVGLVSLNGDATGDTTFGTSNTVTTPLGYGDDVPNAIALQADGKMVVASTMEALGGNDFGVSRYNSNGTLDASFGNAGRMTISLGTSYDEARDVAIQSDGKIVVVGTSNNKFLVVRLNSDGSLDTTFDGDGMVTTAIGNTIALANSVAIQQDGKILVGGTRNGSIFSDPYANRTAALLRYNMDGTLDSTFGLGGAVTSSIGTEVTDIEVLSDGRIAFLSGQLYVRLPNGSADVTFGTNGKTATYGISLAVQQDGKFLVGGSVQVNQVWSLELRRFNHDGSLDATFDGDGLVTVSIPIGSYDHVSVAIQGTKILASGGSYDTGSVGGIILYRFSSDGSADNSFGTNGRVTTSVPSIGHAHDVAVQADGKIVIAGLAYRSSFSGVMFDSFLVRYDGGSAPSDILLSANAIDENSASGTIVASLTSTDADTPEFWTYALVAGVGSNDNSLFSISGSDLVADASFDFEFRSSYSVRIRSTDSTGLWLEKSIAISVNNVNEVPAFSLQNTVTTLLENTSTAAAVQVADIAVTDDAIGTNVFTLSGPDAAVFEIVDSKLRLRAGTALNFESKATYSVTVQLDDSAVGASPDQTTNFTLSVTDVNEAPATVALTNTVSELPENSATSSAIRVADISIADDLTGNNVLSLSGPDVAAFVITGNQLFLNAGSTLNFETKSQYSVTVQVDDSAVGVSPDATVAFVLTVTDVNEAPTSLLLTNVVTNLAENTATTSPIPLADISIVDDAPGVNVLSLSGPDAGAFVITGNQLFLKAGSSLNFETKSNYAVTVQLDDSAVGSSPDATVAYSLSVTDVNEAPTTVSLTSVVTTLPESTTTGAVIRLADIAVTDDASGTNVLSLTGPDAVAFVITGNQLFLKVGTTLNFEAKSQFAVTVQVNDSSVGVSPDATVAFVLTISDVNEAPTAVVLASTVFTLPENTSTNSAIRVADILITDDALGTNILSLTGSDAAAFVITGNQLFLKAGSALNFETKSQYSVTVLLDDSTVGASPDATVAYSLTVTNMNEAPTLSLTSIVTSLNDNVSTNAAIRIADISVTDDATGTNEFLLTGTESDLFEIVDSKLYLKAGSILNGAVTPELRLQVSVIDKALGSDPVTGGSASIQIHVAAITPEIIAPTPLVQPLRPTFAWTSISSATSYDVWFENLSTGNSQYRQENITNSVYTANSDFGIGRYRVQIRSLDASQTPSRWSAPYEFRVTATVTWQPMEAVQRSSYPRLTWNPLPGADHYDLWINSVSPAKNPFVRITNLNQSAWTSSTAFPMGQYQAWVRGFAADGTPVTWSERFDFNVSPTPVLTTAANVAFSGLPTITWNGIAGAVRFDVWVDNASTGTSPFDRASVGGTSYTPSKTLGIGKYRFWVRSIDAAGTTSAWSSRLEFSVNTAATIQPLNRIQVTARPTVTWTALPGASRYDLWIDERSTPTSQAVRITNLTTPSWTPATDLPMGLYRAWVRGIATDGTGATWSQPVEFYVAPAPVLTAGINATFDRTPTFAWNPVAGAVSYNLTVRNLNTGATVINKTAINPTSWTVPTDLPTGLYRWWVLAVNSNGLRSQSANVSEIYIGGRPNVLTPVTGLNHQTLFSWSTVEGAASYMLHVNRIDVPQVAVIQLSGLTGTSYQSTVTLPTGTYRVWMRAVSATGEVSLWNAAVDFGVV